VRQEVDLRIGQPYTYSFRLAVEAGQVRITTEPFAARIFLDDTLVGVGTYVGDVPVGEHRVTVEAAGRPSKTELMSVRADALTNLHVRLPPRRASGRWELLAGATAFAGAAGYSIGVQLVDTEASQALLAVGVTGVAIAGAYFGIPEDIPVGQSSFILGAAVWSSIQGASVSYLVDADAQTGTAVVLASASVTVITASLTTASLDLSEGDAAILNSGVVWGTGMSLILWGLYDRAPKLAGAYMLGGSNLGLLAAIGLASRYELSRGHVALIDLAGVSGCFLGLVLAEPVVARVENTQVGDDTRLHFALGGTLIGLTIGALLTRTMDDPQIPRSLRSGQLTIGRAVDSTGLPVATFGWSGTF
jgi:hypothetical protein